MSRGSGSSPAGGRTPDLVHQAEKINQLFGEFKGLRTQFTEFRKQLHGINPGNLKEMKERMDQTRAELAAAHQSAETLQWCQRTLEQQGGVQAQMRQQLDALAPAASGLTGLQQQLQRVQGQVDPIMQQLRAMQQEQVDPIAQRLRAMQQEQAQSQQKLAEEQAAFRRKLEEAGQQTQRLQGLSQELQQKMRSFDQAASKFEAGQGQVAEAKREVDRMRQEHTSMKQKSEEAVNKVQAVHQQGMEAKRALDQLKQEMNSMKNEQQGAKGHEREREAHMRKLEEKTRGLDELGRLKATMDTTGSAFWALKKQLYDAGVLAPPKEPEPEKVPVGTLELGEDVFTARLLIRLGLMKAQGEIEREQGDGSLLQGEVRTLRGMDSQELELASDNSSDTDMPLRPVRFGLVDNFEENVTGLQVPEIEPGGKGHFLVTAGWVAICVTTLGIQVLIVGIMLMYGMEAGDDCIKEVLPPGKWYMLHVSKAAATLAAGMLMGKDLMDIVNYWMVSELLLTRTSYEVAISAVLRISLILFIAAANVIIFMTMTSPADVWINMTALGFISELSASVLDVAKRGVFGHHIGKAVGSVNYALNFMTDYPWWFAYARSVALTTAACFIGFFAILLYIMPDNICLPDGKSEASNLIERFTNLF